MARKLSPMTVRYIVAAALAVPRLVYAIVLQIEFHFPFRFLSV
jgi:TRAP-type uncharacterized transport system fused permease subunit